MYFLLMKESHETPLIAISSIVIIKNMMNKCGLVIKSRNYARVDVNEETRSTGLARS